MTADDPLRGDCDDPVIRRLVAMLYRPAHPYRAAAFFSGAARGRAEGAR